MRREKKIRWKVFYLSDLFEVKNGKACCSITGSSLKDNLRFTEVTRPGWDLEVVDGDQASTRATGLEYGENR